MGIYFFEKSLSFLGPFLINIFKILKLSQNFRPKLGYLKKKKKLQKMRKFFFFKIKGNEEK